MLTALHDAINPDVAAATVLGAFDIFVEFDAPVFATLAAWVDQTSQLAGVTVRSVALVDFGNTQHSWYPGEPATGAEE